jgi:hypothetical protein
MAARFCNYNKRLSFIFLIFFLLCYSAAAQKLISGDINQPFAHVSSIITDRVTVDDITGFSANDTVLLIQMQGVGILTEEIVYGNYQNSYGQPGIHEFLIIQSVSLPGTIIFKNNIINSYDVDGNVQIVRVPTYNKVTVEGRVFCDPWDSSAGKGGVIAIIAGSSVTLNADIDVSGLGLRGGAASAGEGRCQDESPQTSGAKYPFTFANAGIKGEGIAIHDRYKVLLYPGNAKGQGPNYTGGGGGNGRYSGGGGGSNRGEGGIGGYEDPYCNQSPMQSLGGGWRGKKIGPELASRIFAGGGGGASTSASGISGAGGNGGGIVIIVADSLISGGGRIVADGGTGANGSATGGAGGGGGGGSIALAVSGYKTSVILSAKGGNGGNNSSLFGEGGGGGGGLVYLNKPDARVSSSYTGGNPGNHPDHVGALAGAEGEKKDNFNVQLNGFLFNSIRSSVTGSQVDSICSDTQVGLLTGTLPVGGLPPYTYTWEKSYDQLTWTTLVSSSTAVNYDPNVIETTTVYYRRIVTDNSMPVLTDISKTVKIIVQPYIKNNLVGNDAIVCFRQDPVTLISTGVLADGNGIYSFTWEVSPDAAVYALPANTYDAENYTPPPAIELDSWYRRTVRSGRCISVSAPVFIDVLDTISNNRILNIPPEICFGMSFDNLQGSTESTSPVLSGGDNTFRYIWESNLNGDGWTTAPGAGNLPDYNPQEPSERIPYNDYMFRRIVLSGAGDVCSSTSNTVTLRDYAAVQNNIVADNQVICSGSTPAQLTGLEPANGNGIYAYTWQDSSKFHDWADISGATHVNFQPPSLTDTTRYRRIVRSSACTSYSNSLKVTVHKPISGNTVALLSGGSDTTLCFSQVPFRISGSLPSGGTGNTGDWLYQWLSSADNITFNPVAAGGAGRDYQAPALAATTYYKRQASSGACAVISASTVAVNVLPQLINNNISADQTICYNTVPAGLNGTTPSGGQEGSYTYNWEESANGGTTWVNSAGGNSRDFSPAALTIPMKYRRVVTSGLAGCCTSVSPELTVSLHPPLPTGIITNISDTTVCGGSTVQLKVLLTGTGPWRVTYADNAEAGSVANVTTFSSVVPAPVTSATSVSSHALTLYRIEDANGCLAVSMTGTKLSTVYKVPVPNAGNDTSVCGPAVRLNARASTGTGLWTFPPAALTVPSADPAATVTIDSSLFTGGRLVQRFHWRETNWQCTARDSVDITFYKRVSSINAGPDETFYSAFREFELKNDPPLQWETGTWIVEKGSGSFIPGRVTGISEGINQYKWTITNGNCSLSDLLDVLVLPLDIPEGFSPNNDPDGYNNTFEIRGLNRNDNEAELRIINGAGIEVFSTSSTPASQDNWKDWDGKNNRGNDVPEGTYYYVLKITPVGLSEPQKPVKVSGFVILKRK